MKDIKCPLCEKTFAINEDRLVDPTIGCISNQLLKRDPKKCTSKKKKRGKD